MSHIKIDSEGNTKMCEEAHSTLYKFRDNIEKLGYKIEYSDYSPYYSGHEWTDTRKENERYSILKEGREVASLAVEREGSNFPQSNFPNDQSDFSITIYNILKDLEDKVLANNFAYLFQKLEKIVLGK